MSNDPDWFNRVMLAIAGILGAGGVVAAAAASHAGNARIYDAAALIALPHAAAMVAFGLASPRGWLLRIGALAVGAGACLFCGDLTVRQIFGVGFLPMAAPAGGTAIIIGWAVVAVAGMIGKRG